MSFNPVLKMPLRVSLSAGLQKLSQSSGFHITKIDAKFNLWRHNCTLDRCFDRKTSLFWNKFCTLPPWFHGYLGTPPPCYPPFPHCFPIAAFLPPGTLINSAANCRVAMDMWVWPTPKACRRRCHRKSWRSPDAGCDGQFEWLTRHEMFFLSKV